MRKGTNTLAFVVLWVYMFSGSSPLIAQSPNEIKNSIGMKLVLEAEWEYACRAGSTTAFSFGEDPNSLRDYAWFMRNSDAQTHPVGKKKPNAWGLYDMHGNVWEWCSDRYGDYLEVAASNRSGPSKEAFPVRRGGSTYNDASVCRSARRLGRNPQNYISGLIGFRVAISAPTSPGAGNEQNR